MKHILIIALVTAFAFAFLPMEVSAQSQVTRKPKQEQKAKAKPKPAAPKPKQKPSPKPKSTPKREGPIERHSPSPSVTHTTPTPAPTPTVVSPLQSELNKLANSMVYVSGGTFMMGANPGDSDAFGNEKPRHQVSLSSFYICKYEVTQALWRAVMGSNPSYFKGDSLPVESVSWNDCQQFIRKLNYLTGQNYRLPTEAEWEFAARGGNSSCGYKYSGSDYIYNVAWNSDSGDKTHVVGTKSPNELGLYDMSGNVYEWCSDWYGSYSSSSQPNPTGALSGSSRVVRGGSWRYVDTFCRVSYRNNFAPSISFNNLGLRLARS